MVAHVHHGSPKPSHVLKAIGVSDNLALGTLRITYGERNTIEDAKYLVGNIKEAIHLIRNRY